MSMESPNNKTCIMDGSGLRATCGVRSVTTNKENRDMGDSSRTIEVSVDSDDMMDTYSHITAEIVEVSPTMAERMLYRNIRNRSINASHTRNLVSVFQAGHMVLNGETIIFDEDENLLDGQHRLTACVQSGVPFVTVVIKGIQASAFDTIDSGRKRTAGEVLSLKGVSHGNQITSAVQMLLSYAATGQFGSSGSNSRCRQATVPMVEKVLAAHPALKESVLAMTRGLKPMANQHGYSLHYLFGTVSRRLADDFASVLAEGSPDIRRPFNVFRESLIRVPMGAASRRTYAAKAIKAFNAEYAGLRPKMFKYIEGEEYPVIAGLDFDAFVKSMG